MGDGRPDFSFSGLKTAVTKYVRESGLKPVTNGEEPSQGIKDHLPKSADYNPIRDALDEIRYGPPAGKPSRAVHTVHLPRR